MATFRPLRPTRVAALTAALLLTPALPRLRAQTTSPATTPPAPPAATRGAQIAGQRTQAAPLAKLKSNVTLVDVPIIVLDQNDQPITDLTLSDFSLTDDYKKQQLTYLDSQPRPVTLAIVVDTSDRASVKQAQRSAQVIADMVIGAGGEAALFIPGPEARQITPFTRNQDEIVAAIRKLKLTPVGLDVTAPLEKAETALRRQPLNRTKAVLVITRRNPKLGAFSQALMEGSMGDSAPVFRVYPDTPQGAPPPDPLDPFTNGTGVGSQREQMPVQPVGAHGQMPQPTPEGTGLNVGAIASALETKFLRSKTWNYVYTSGGLDLHAGNDREFDQDLSRVGNVLRATYHLYYDPNDLTAGPAMHLIYVRVSPTTGVKRTTYRHTYVGMKG